MATYAIGDIQGCYEELQALLAIIAFDERKDQLWFAGDLVNRGPHSLEVLRFIKNLNDAIVVLGNHDLHLLVVASGHASRSASHTLDAILSAPDCSELIDWLRRQPFMHYDAHLGYAMVHAGILPAWELSEACEYAEEVSACLRSSDYAVALPHLYGNEPLTWDHSLSDWDKLRFITNVFTRLRFCTPEGKLDLKSTGPVGTQPPGYFPWFEVPARKLSQLPIVFGHWAALMGETHHPYALATDTGCIWGHSLTALRLEDRKRFQVNALGSINSL